TALSVSAPGVQGGFQVLYNHASLLSGLEIGQIKIMTGPEKDILIATSGGILEARDNKVTLLVETAERSDEIDVGRAQRARESAERRLTERDSEIDLERAKFAMRRALNRLRVAEKV
ncbi:MAG: ATP synthase F1 subunit epsilon, partial [Bacteroidetes bacterium]|nr:ATP synthase F1 subunit epsilon [Bacteroidota bacterium]